MWSRWPPWSLDFSVFHHFCTLGARDTLSWDIGIPFIITGRFMCRSIDSLCTSSVCWLILFTWTLGTTEVVLAGTVVFTAASLRCILFLLYSPCVVCTIYDLDVSAFDLPTTLLHLLLEESCTLTGWVGRRVDLSLAWASYLWKCCLDCNDDLATSLFLEG